MAMKKPSQKELPWTAYPMASITWTRDIATQGQKRVLNFGFWSSSAWSTDKMWPSEDKSSMAQYISHKMNIISLKALSKTKFVPLPDSLISWVLFRPKTSEDPCSIWWQISSLEYSNSGRMYGKMNETEKENNELEYHNFEVIYAKNTKQFIVFYNVGYYQPQNQVTQTSGEIEYMV